MLAKRDVSSPFSSAADRRGVRASALHPRAKALAAPADRQHDDNSATTPTSQNIHVARRNALNAISACVSHGSVCRDCWNTDDDLRDDVEHQRGDHADRDHRDEHRIDQRQADLLPQRLPRLEVVGEPREDT